MKALVHDGNGHIALEDRPEPQLQSPTDAIVRVTRSTICTSDLHIIHGAVPRATPNTVLGHEFVGVIEQVGEGVRALKPGDRVAVSCETFCGECFCCERGWVNNCVEGGWELGCCADGCQAELVRVAHADHTCAPIPLDVSALPGRHRCHGPLGREHRRDRAWLHGGCDRRRPGRPHHHDVRPSA